jgi:hypothetical protein
VRTLRTERRRLRIAAGGGRPGGPGVRRSETPNIRSTREHDTSMGTVVYTKQRCNLAAWLPMTKSCVSLSTQIAVDASVHAHGDWLPPLGNPAQQQACARSVTV